MRGFEAFERGALRADRLVEAHGAIHGGGRGRPAQQAADVLRAAVVFSVAALDAFILECMVEAVPQLARQGRLGEKADKMASSSQLLAAFAQASPHDYLTSVAQEKFGAITFQKAAAIEMNLRDYLGYQVDWTAVATARRFATGEAAKAELDTFVLRRHRIAHANDRESGSNRASPISVPFTKRCLTMIRTVALVVDRGLDTHLTPPA